MVKEFCVAQSKAKAFADTQQTSICRVKVEGLVCQNARLSSQMQTEKKECKKTDLIGFANATASEAQADLPPHGPRSASEIKPCGVRRSEAKEDDEKPKTKPVDAAFCLKSSL